MPKPAKFLNVDVAKSSLRQRFFEILQIVLRVVPRAWNSADIDELLHSMRFKKLDECHELPCRMADGKDGQRLRFCRARHRLSPRRMFTHPIGDAVESLPDIFDRVGE